MMRKVSIYILLAQSVWFCAAGERAETITHSSCVACVDELESHANQLAELQGRYAQLEGRYAKLEKELEECRAGPELERSRSRQRRVLTTTPAPTPLTPVPTPFTPVLTTATPSASPSASPVPTTEGITTHAQLAAAVADEISEIVIEADILFPSQAPIVVTGSLSVFGNGSDGGRVTLDGHGRSRHFHVLGGTLHLAFLNFANGTTPSQNGCTGNSALCGGGAILVEEGGSLVMRSCAIRGGGPGVELNAYEGGGVMVVDAGSTGKFFDVVFSNLVATYGACAYGKGYSGMIEAHFFGCQFLDSAVTSGTGTVFFWSEDTTGSLFDCLFERNMGAALSIIDAGDIFTIVRCTFRDNVGSTVSWLSSAGAGGLVVAYGSSTAEVTDCIFERNRAAQGNNGGGMSVYNQAAATLRNVSFLSNEGGALGGSLTVGSSASVVCIECSSLGGVADRANHIVVVASSLVMHNSTVAESTGASALLEIRDGSSAAFFNSVFRDSTVSINGGIHVHEGSAALVADCVISGMRAGYNSIGEVSSESSLRMVRTTVRDNRVTSGAGCIEIYSGGTLEIVDSDIIGSVAGDDGGPAVFLVSSGGVVTMTDSRIDGNIGTGKGVIATVEGDASALRIVRSTITNTSGPFAINDMTETDFSVQLDTVTVDSTFHILSHGAVLVQNCDGLSSTMVKNASIGTCGSTADYCIPESCTDSQAVGIECSCFVDGLPTVRSNNTRLD